MSTTKGHSIEKLMAFTAASREDQRKEAREAYQKTLENFSSPSEVPTVSAMSDRKLKKPSDNPFAVVVEEVFDLEPAFWSYPTDMSLDTHGPLLKETRIVSFSEYADVGKLSVKEAIKHACAQLREGQGKVKSALRRFDAAFNKENLCRRHLGQPEVSRADFEDLYIGQYLEDVGQEFGPVGIRRKSKARGEQRKPSPKAPPGGALAT